MLEFLLIVGELSPSLPSTFLRKHHSKVFHSNTTLLLTMPEMIWDITSCVIIHLIRVVADSNWGLLGYFGRFGLLLRKQFRI